MKRITRDNVHYEMSVDNKAVIHISEGESLCFEVEDCYSGNLRSPEHTFTKEMWGTVNPATGPAYVDGAQPGDILRVDIERINVRQYAVMCLEAGTGALGECFSGVETSIYPIKDDRLIFSDRISIPIRPMIGVIGVAPKGKGVLNGTPGEHGGNMDCREIGAGSKVYLPVNADGALLSLGDLHAVMGDGEACICGAEVSGEVVLNTKLMHGYIPTPCVETDTNLYFIGSALGLDECESIVLKKAMSFLTGVLAFKARDAARIMSLIGNLQVCQVVDPLKTMRFSLPKLLLESCSLEKAIVHARRQN